MKEAISFLFSALRDLFAILADWAKLAKEISDEALKEIQEERNGKPS